MQPVCSVVVLIQEVANHFFGKIARDLTAFAWRLLSFARHGSDLVANGQVHCMTLWYRRKIQIIICEKEICSNALHNTVKSHSRSRQVLSRWVLPHSFHLLFSRMLRATRSTKSLSPLILPRTCSKHVSCIIPLCTFDIWRGTHKESSTERWTSMS